MTTKRIYLDACSIQRPFDDRSQPRIAIECEAILVILDLCKAGDFSLVSSEALIYEINQMPDSYKKEGSLAILEQAIEFIKIDDKIEKLAIQFKRQSIRSLDSLHLACASSNNLELFCTCDDNFYKKAKKLDYLNTNVFLPTELALEVNK
ncbi:MAG: PIN domain-containing protein [Proteobacteria bacterium]|nr:PIN domain-containing protein [Pseudomonadota bacterium]